MSNSANELNVDIIDYPGKYLVGFKVRSNVSRSSMDCPPLWEKLHANLNKFPGRTRNQTYGLFRMVDDFITFDFWVAVAVPPDFKTPPRMEAIELEAGQYARCHVPSGAEVLLAYSTLYSTWYHAQEEYDIVKRGPCFELYPPRWTANDPFEVCIRVAPRPQGR